MGNVLAWSGKPAWEVTTPMNVPQEVVAIVQQYYVLSLHNMRMVVGYHATCTLHWRRYCDDGPYALAVLDRATVQSELRFRRAQAGGNEAVVWESDVFSTMVVREASDLLAARFDAKIGLTKQVEEGMAEWIDANVSAITRHPHTPLARDVIDRIVQRLASVYDLGMRCRPVVGAAYASMTSLWRCETCRVYRRRRPYDTAHTIFIRALTDDDRSTADYVLSGRAARDKEQRYAEEHSGL